MTCDNALELLSAALDGELSVEEKAQLDCHLAQCDGCRALFDDLAAIHGACAGLEITPPSTLKANILQNLPAQEKPVKVIWVHWKRWAAMAATFVLVSLAAWNLPKTGFTDGSQALPEQAAITQNDALTETAGVISSPAEVSGVANDQPYVDTPVGSEGISDPESAADSALAPTPSPDFFSGDPVNVNASAATTTGGAAQKKFAVTGYGSASKEAAIEYTTTYKGLGDSTLFDTDAAEDATVSDEILPMLYSVRMASPSPTAAPSEQPVSANGALDLSTSLDDEAIPEPHPEIEKEENVPVTLFKTTVAEEADATYCGVITLRGPMPLMAYTAREQENGALWYELPHTAFRALVDELTDSAMEFDLRVTGTDISSSAQTGLVIVLP